MKSRLPILLLTILFVLPSGGARAGTWSKRDVSVPRPTAMPPSHEWSPTFLRLVYDSRRRVVVGIGGHAKPSLSYLPVSEYDSSTWISRYDGSTANTPPYRSIGNAVFDTRRNVTVIFGGWVGNTQNPLNELWEYDGTWWTQRTWEGPGPAKSVSVPMCFDPVRGRTICLTLHKTGGVWETWEWTGDAWDRGPDLTGVNDGSLTAMVFDTARNKAFVYTTAQGSDFEKTFEYTPGPVANQGVWTNVPISGAPFEAKQGVALVYDPYRERVLRHGGRFVSGIYSYIDATYEWDPAQARWTLIAFLPELGRGGAGICFDTHRILTVLYGGVRVWLEDGKLGRTTTYTDTWEFVDNRPGETWVDFGYTGAEVGSPQQPWNSLAEALVHAPSRGEVIFKMGVSSETPISWSGPLHFKAWNGQVTIGK